MVSIAHRWLRGFLPSLLMAALLVSACAPAAPPSPTPAPTKPAPPAAQPTPITRPAAAPTAEPRAEATRPAAVPAPRKSVKLKFGAASSLGFSDVPSQSAFEDLKATGVEVQLVPFPQTDLATKALLSGQVDFAIVNPPGFLAANREGADLRVFFNGKRNEWVLMAPSSIKEPKQLDGKRIAHHGTGITKALAQYVGDRYGIKPNYLTVPGSEARVQALIQGQIDASPVDIAGMLALDRLKPGAFHALIKFEEELPGILQADHYTTRRSQLADDPDTWQTLVAGLVRNYRRATMEPEWLADQAVKFLPRTSRDEMLAFARAYARIGVFTVDGGLNKERMEKMLTFYVERGLIKKEDVLPFDQFATTRFVEAANAQTSRQ